MPTIGQRVREIRIREVERTFRVVYVAKFEEVIFVLHCFQKKPQTTRREDIAIAMQRFARVWDAIEDTPAAAENMKLRSALMVALKAHIEREGLNQSQAAALLRVTQPRVSDLMRGKINLFTIDTLINMLTAAGGHVEMQIAKAA